MSSDTSTPHRKHSALPRPTYGEFHRREWAILGAPCEKVQALAERLTAALHDRYRVAYVDASHQPAPQPPALAAGAELSYTDQIGYQSWAQRGPQPNAFHRRPFFQGADLVLVNGNHFRANSQIVILDPTKRDSLERHIDRLSGIDLVLITGELNHPYPFLAQLLERDQPPRLPLEDTDAIVRWLVPKLAAPALRGLVLAGGQSQRMGEDKGLLAYHGRPQRDWLCDLLAPITREVYLALRPGQPYDGTHTTLHDTFTDLGPYGALLSAFRQQPDSAWLTVACDLPLLDEALFRQLIEQRDPSRLATAIHNPQTGWPEPLITIWEPRAYPVLLQFLAQGISCPRKVLINSDVKVIQVNAPEKLRNVNHPEERDELMRRLG